jgi:hypothetical protein
MTALSAVSLLNARRSGPGRTRLGLRGANEASLIVQAFTVQLILRIIPQLK